jgi:hypothetical protein
MWKLIRFSEIWCPVRTWAILISNENQQAGSHGSSHWLVLTANGTENQRQFLADDWEPPNTGQKTRSNSVWHKKWCISEFDPPLKANVLFYRFFKNLTRIWTKLRVLVPCFLDFTENSIMFNIWENSSFLSF